MTQVQVSRSESRWATGALLALGIMLMGLLLSLPFLVRSLLFQPFNLHSAPSSRTTLGLVGGELLAWTVDGGWY